MNGETLEMLEKVKKGGPARFIMISKGPNILNIVAYRKGDENTHLKEAKTGGVGDISKGVIEGSGQNFTFKLMRAEYPKEPVENVKLKKYMKDNGYECKPEIVLVDTLPDVAEEGTVMPLRPTTPPQQSNTSAPTQPVTQQPGPNQPTGQQRRPLEREQQVGTYRSKPEWDRILEVLKKAPNGPPKRAVIDRVVADIKRERDQLTADQSLANDPTKKRAIEDLHAYVAKQMKTLVSGPTIPQQADTTAPNSTGAKTTAPNTTAQTPNPTPPQGPTVNGGPRVMPIRPLTPEQLSRQGFGDNAKRRAAAATTRFKGTYNDKKLADAKKECETDGESDFGKICGKMLPRRNENYNQGIARIDLAIAEAQKYIKDHPDPMLGKLPTRVIKRRDYCQKFLTELRSARDTMVQAEASAVAMAETFDAHLKRKENLPVTVAEELEKAARGVLTDNTKAELKRIAAEIRKLDQDRGKAKFDQLVNPSDFDRAEVMLGHGLYSGGGGGTSDVRLLRNPKTNAIEFAFKGREGEAQGGLDTLKLPPGASATREDLCSKLNQEVMAQTGIDFGFPKASVVSINGETGALIEGIKGKTVDPEESQQIQDKLNRTGKDSDPVLDAELSEVKRRLAEFPDKISAKSMGKVALFSALSCQWDCKWGNLMVENEKDARPIDGGGAFPTQDAIDSFGQDYKVVPLNLMGLTTYPIGHPKFGQVMPQAQQPMDPELVTAMTNLDVDKMITELKARRDDIARTHKDLAPPPHTQGLVDDATFGRMKASIDASKAIIAKNPKLTLEQFCTEYTDWWVKYIEANRRPEAVKWGKPDPQKAGAKV